MLNRHRKLNMEQMEAREMMAGDVAGYVSNNTLYLYESYQQAGRDNSVVVSQVAPGTIRVRGGVTADGTTSKVNGAAYTDFQVTGGLNIAFGGGNDTVYLGPSGASNGTSYGGGSLAAPSFNDVYIDVAAPATTRTLSTSTSFTSVAPPDNDRVTISKVTVPGWLTINTGMGDDQVSVIDTVVGKANLKSGAAPTGGIKVNTGLGNDTITFDGLSSNHDINVDAGAGNDKLDLLKVAVTDNLMAELGDGDDLMSIGSLSMRFSHAATRKLSGGNGTDRLTGPGIGWFDATGWEYINGVQQPLFSLPGDLVTAV